MTMEVLVNIKKLDIHKTYDYMEFVSKDLRVSVKDSFTLAITSIHDLLFGESKLFFMSKSLGLSRLVGVVIIKNLLFHSLNKVEHVLHVRDKSYVNRIERYTPEPPKSIDSITIEFKVTQIDKKVLRTPENGFVKKIFNFLFSIEQENLFENLMDVFAEALKGSNRCRFKIIHGANLIESYLSYLNEINTKNLDFNRLLTRKICVTKHNKNQNKDERNVQDRITVIKTNKTLRNHEDSDISDDEVNADDNGTDNSLEYFIIGKTYKQITLDKHLKVTRLNLRFQTIPIKHRDNRWSLSGIFSNIFKIQSQIEDVREESITAVNGEPEISQKDFEQPTFSSVDHIQNTNENTEFIHMDDQNFFYCFEKNQYNLKKVLKPNNHQVQHFHEIMSNDGYMIGGKSFLEGIHDLFYLSISSYGNTWPTLLIKRRFKAENESIEHFRKAVLQFTGILDDDLKVVSLSTPGIPDYIIFYEKDKERIVVSFKGTSNSKEALHDLDCGYGSFYEGFAHNGIKNLALSYVEKKIDELLELSSKLDTKKILITGHSLGGSISILVHMILSKDERMEGFDIYTFAFSAAPVVSYNLALDPYPNLFVVNYGNDLVSRLSYGSVCESKYLCCSVGTNKNFQSKDETKVDLYNAKKYASTKGIYPKLYFPGQVYNFKRIKVNYERKIISLVLYKKVNLNFYEDVLILKHASLHHMPSHILNVLGESIKDLSDLKL